VGVPVDVVARQIPKELGDEERKGAVDVGSEVVVVWVERGMLAIEIAWDAVGPGDSRDDHRLEAFIGMEVEIAAPVKALEP
jgi:hypothetical protein